ncbi:preprotein translocase subunit SecG [Chamaesiphon sp. GL140_3_metabinner_50]|uniref:preprotein translocase subunit SecG n=1 Tax=Chamaesiphon sp. GL140_3_metabinner_50 TaxID=2970812 RepID=UPI0025F79E5B|nr:preprotein translocase subunit SecG [Chamaesiphon sp. GL140_3_metabinner_50]
MNTANIIEIIWCISAFGLTAMVLLHSPKGDGIGGIGGQAQLFSSTKSAESSLNRVTWGLFLVFITLTIILSLPNTGAVVPPVVSPPVLP